MRLEERIAASYRRRVPEAIRQRIWWMRRRTRRACHQLRWTIMPRRVRERWVTSRLGLGRATWLFLLGCNNSGTTLLAEVLGAHPGIRSLPKEGQRVTTAIPNSADYGIGRVFTQRMDLFRWTEASAAECLPRLLYDWAALYRTGEGVLLEKSPPNTLRSRWLQQHFRPARFVILTRHPYAVCEGIRRRRGHTIEEAASHWACVHRVLEEDEPFLEHCLTVRYEDLCSQSMRILREIERFVGLNAWYEEEFLARSFRAHNAIGAPQRIQDFNARSVRRLSEVELRTISEIAREQMSRLGYEQLPAALCSSQSA